jgi:hypothetical protein
VLYMRMVITPLWWSFRIRYSCVSRQSLGHCEALSEAGLTACSKTCVREQKHTIELLFFSVNAGPLAGGVGYSAAGSVSIRLPHS